MRPILKPRATGDVPAAPRPQLKPLRLPDAPAEVAPPPAPRSAPPAVAPLPAAAAAPLAPPVVRQAPERPDLRLRRSREQEQQEVQQQSNWEVHFGRQGMRRKENIQGPFTWEELGCLVRNGTLDPTHRVRQAGTEEWQAASSVEGLFSRMNLQARQIKEERAEREAKQAREDEGGFFGPENWVLNHLGPAGGLLLMAIAAIWFFVAYQDGVIYFYPPVLFLVGLVGLFKR